MDWLLRATLGLVAILLVLAWQALPAGAAAKTVVLDPGHGGKDPGAVGRSGGTALREADVNLDIALRTEALLKSSGFGVIMTRRTNVYVTLGSRVNLANKAKADIFVSLHNNSSTSGAAQGTMTFYHSSSEASKQLAEFIHKEVVKRIGRPDKGTKHGEGLYVIRHTIMPAVLVEGAFLSNSTEKSLLSSPSFRQKIAEGVAAGIIQYFEHVRPLPAAHTSPNPFSPDRDGLNDVLGFRYKLDRPARVTVKVFDWRGLVRTVIANTYRGAGYQAEGWTGTNDRGNVLPDGNYRYTVTALDSLGTLYHSGIVSVRARPIVFRHWAQPNPISPNFDGDKDASALYFSLDRRAVIRLTLYNYRGPVRALIKDETFAQGRFRRWWTGTTDRGKVLPDGTYRWVMEARNWAGLKTVAGTVTLQAAPRITGYQARVSPVAAASSGVHMVSICYRLDRPGKVSLLIRDYRGEVKNLLRLVSRTAGSHCEGWPGTNNQGNVLPAGNYGYVLSATAGGGMRTVTGVAPLRRAK